MFRRIFIAKVVALVMALMFAFTSCVMAAPLDKQDSASTLRPPSAENTSTPASFKGDAGNLGGVSLSDTYSEKAIEQREEYDKYIKMAITVENGATSVFGKRLSLRNGDTAIEQNTEKGEFWDTLRGLQDKLPKDFDLIILDTKQPLPENIIMHPSRYRKQSYIDARYIKELEKIYYSLSGDYQALLMDILLEALKHEVKHIELEGQLGEHPSPLAELWIDKKAPAFMARSFFKVLYAKIITGDDRISARDFLRKINAIIKTTNNRYSSYLYAIEGLTPVEHLEMAEKLAKIANGQTYGNATISLAQYHIACVLYYVYVEKRYSMLDKKADPELIQLKEKSIKFLKDHPYYGNSLNFGKEKQEYYYTYHFAQHLLSKVVRSKTMYEYAIKHGGLKINVMVPEIESTRRFIKGTKDKAGDTILMPIAPDANCTTLDIPLLDVEEKIDSLLGSGTAAKWEQNPDTEASIKDNGDGQTKISLKALTEIGEKLRPKTMMSLAASGKGLRFAALDKKIDESGKPVPVFVRIDDNDKQYVKSGFSTEFETEINGEKITAGVRTSDVAKGAFIEDYGQFGMRSFTEQFIASVFYEQQKSQQKSPLPVEIYTSILTDNEVRKELERLGYIQSLRHPDMYVHLIPNTPVVIVVKLPSLPMFYEQSDDFIGEIYPELNYQEKVWPDAHDGSHTEPLMGNILSRPSALDEKNGYRFRFVGNVDNRAAVYDPTLVAILYLEETAMVNEVCVKPQGQKGGAPAAFDLTKTNGLLGRYSAYTQFNQGKVLIEGFHHHPATDQADSDLFPFFNSASYVDDEVNMAKDLLLRNPQASSQEVEKIFKRLNDAKRSGDAEEYHRLRFEIIMSRYKAQTQGFEPDPRKRLKAHDPSNLAGNITGLVSTSYVSIPTGDTEEGKKKGIELWPSRQPWTSRFEPQKDRFDNSKNVEQAKEFLRNLSQKISQDGKRYSELTLAQILKDLQEKYKTSPGDYKDELFQTFCELDFHIKNFKGNEAKEEAGKKIDEAIKTVEKLAEKAKQMRTRVVDRGTQTYFPKLDDSEIGFVAGKDFVTATADLKEGNVSSTTTDYFAKAVENAETKLKSTDADDPTKTLANAVIKRSKASIDIINIALSLKSGRIAAIKSNSTLIIDKEFPAIDILEKNLEEAKKALGCNLVIADKDNIEGLKGMYNTNNAIVLTIGKNKDIFTQLGIRVISTEGAVNEQFLYLPRLIILAKGILACINADRSTAGGLKSDILNLYEQITGQKFTGNIDELLNNAAYVLTLELPAPDVVYEKGELEELQRQALAVLIAA